MFSAPGPAVPKTASDFDFETNSLKNELAFFKKLEYLFLAESTKTENEKFPYKTALLEANETNRMRSTKWTYHKERSFTNNYFF